MNPPGVERLVRDHIGEDAACASPKRLSGGASRETWSVDAVLGSGETIPLIARLDLDHPPPGGVPAPGALLAAPGLEREARLLRTAAECGVPVPRVFGATDSYILMERVEGETIPRRILRSPPPGLAAQCGTILADLHRMPGDGLDDPRSVQGVADPLEFWRRVLDACAEPHPVFELAFRRLTAARPARDRTTVVHGDFRNGNLIVGPEGVRAVLDWELTHLGDPLEDLGWLCAKAWRFGSELPVGGFGTYEELVGAYESASGHRVDLDALRWWETFGTLKWGIICIMQTLRHVRGGTPSVELAAIGRRVCETEWDILHAL